MKPPPRTFTIHVARVAPLSILVGTVPLACTPPPEPPTTVPVASAATATAMSSSTVADMASATATAPAPAATGTIVAGRVARIELQNVSKAQGHYHYNVSLLVEGTIDGIWPFATPRPSRYEVRVDKLYWSELDDAARAAIAPEGPKHRLTPARYGRYAVGDAVRLPVRPSSPDIGWLEGI